jgi:DNA-directed RNA polymerase, mitochondrial
MDWLQDVARVMAKAKLPLVWTTPTGFKVLQKYYKVETKRINTLWGNTRIQLTVVNPTTQLNPIKQAAGIAPNYIHSMDASHLILTINACKKEGIDDFSMIHDSFGCHACDVPKLNRILRETFVEMYSTDNLKTFIEEVKSQCPNDTLSSMIPDVPTMGNLDINLVKESPYFFA